MIKIKFKISIFDKHGRLVDSVEKECKSFLRNFALILRGLFEGYDNTVTLKDTGGSTFGYPRANGACYDFLNIRADIGIDTFGIQVGTGTGSVSRDDYQLEALIPCGSGDGELDYRETVVSDVDGSPPASEFTVSRQFDNNGSVDVTINEVGLVAEVQGADSLYHDVLIARDVLSTPKTVPAGGSVTVTYTIRVTA